MRIIGSASLQAKLPSQPRSRLYLEPLERRDMPSTVTNLADAGPGSLRDTLATTPSGGIVDFQPGLSGTILLTSGELEIAKDVAIIGPGSSTITVSGDHATRVFNVASTVTAVISEITIAAGLSNLGGGIENSGTLTITSCTITGNTAMGSFVDQGEGGGAIFNEGTLTIAGSILADNSAQNAFGAAGGGIANTGTLTVTNSRLSDNNAPTDYTFGGGIISSGPLTISGCTLAGNSASFGGAVSLMAGASLRITDSTLCGNGAIDGGGIFGDGTLIVMTSIIANNWAGSPAIGGDGAGIFNKGVAVIADSLITQNTNEDGGATLDNLSEMLTVMDSTISANYGNGIANESPATLTVIDSTITGNSAPWGGGIINWGTASIVESTISRNRATAIAFSLGGGGISDFSHGLATLSNTIIAGNTAAFAPDVDGAVVSLGHNLIGDSSGSSGFVDTDLLGTPDRPLNPLLGPLRDNGGPTPTMALLPGSPALGAGAPTDSEWDQRGPGYPRWVNGAPDIGAYEVQEEQGTGPSVPTLHFPEIVLPMRRDATSQAAAPTPAADAANTPGIPLRPRLADVDRFFASRGQETGAFSSRHTRPYPGEADGLVPFRPALISPRFHTPEPPSLP